MKLCTLLQAATTLVVAATPVAAQRAPAPLRGEIHGVVVNSASKTPVTAAVIDVLRATTPDSVARTSSTNTGTFRVQGLRPGRYRLRIRALGYTPLILPPSEISAATPSVDVGTVELAASALELQSLTVTAQRPDVQLAPDRSTFVVRDMPTTRGGTALDVLRNVPAVDVDIDNVVSLRGNSGVIIQINGRPSPMKPAQLGNYLAQLPSDMVDKVEVIPNPSAKDDPEGVAGIINIVLKREADAGTSGGLTIGGGTTGRADIGGSLGYQRHALSLYGSYGFLRDNRPRAEALYRENLFRDPLTYLEETGKRTQIPLAHTLTGSAGYRISPRDELSADLTYSTRVEAETYGIEYRDLNAARILTGMSDRFTSHTNHEFNFESTVGYKHTYAEKGHKLTGELRFVKDGEGGPSSIAARTLSLSGSPLDTAALEHQTAWERPQEPSLKVDYVRPLSKLVRFETGYKGYLLQFHTTLDTEVFDEALGSYQPDSARISDFTFRELVNAAYGLLNAQRGKFVWQAGLRVERTATRFHLRTSDSTYHNPYHSLFPSALVAYNINDAHQLKLSYSTRIRRPDEPDQLDPTPRYADPLNLFRGNPYLKPEYIRALELGLQRTEDHATIQVTPFFRHTVDAVRGLRSIDSAGVSTRTFANVATSDAYGADATVALSGGRLSGFAGASAFRQVSNAANVGPGLNARTFGWTARTNASLKVTGGMDVQALLSYRGAMTVEQGKNASQTRFSLAARQKLMDDQMSLTLRVVDPFNTSREKSTTIDPRFYQVSDRTRAIRGLVLSVNWTFGKPFKEQEPPPIDQSAGR